jgi:hypothetical protein
MTPADELAMRLSSDPDPDERPVSFLGRPAPAGMALRLVSIPVHAELDYQPSDWAGAVVIVEVGEIELECASGARASFGPSSILFFDGLGLRTIRNVGTETVLLSAASRRVTGQSTPSATPS